LFVGILARMRGEVRGEVEGIHNEKKKGILFTFDRHGLAVNFAVVSVPPIFHLIGL
jgi:hypothetical protein